MRRCSTCGIAKKLTAFGRQKRKNKLSGYRASCLVCRGGYEKKRYQTFTDEQKTAKRDYTFRKTYGITLNDYNSMLSKQQGLCLGCGRHQTEFEKALAEYLEAATS